MFFGLCYYFVSVAERDFMPQGALTKRLVYRARPGDGADGFAADWTLAQFREPVQGIAENIEALINPEGS